MASVGVRGALLTSLKAYGNAHPRRPTGFRCSVCALPPAVLKEINAAYTAKTHTVRQIHGYLADPPERDGLGLKVTHAALQHHFYSARHHEKVA